MQMDVFLVNQVFFMKECVKRAKQFMVVDVLNAIARHAILVLMTYVVSKARRLFLMEVVKLSVEHAKCMVSSVRIALKPDAVYVKMVMS